MEGLFNIKGRGSSAGAEIASGLTSFLSASYLIFISSELLSGAGMSYPAVFIASCLASALGSFVMALLFNLPLTQTPGIGVSIFFAFTVCGRFGYTWPQALTIAFISGVLCFVVSLTPLRSHIVSVMPTQIKKAAFAGVGLLTVLLGFAGAGMVSAASGTAALLSLGSLTSGSALLALIGLVITAVLLTWEIKGALLIGVGVTTLIGVPLGVTVLEAPAAANLTLGSFLFFDFGGLLSAGVVKLAVSVLTFTVICLLASFEPIAKRAEHRPAAEDAAEPGEIAEDASENVETADSDADTALDDGPGAFFESGEIALANAVASSAAPMFGAAPLSVYQESFDDAKERGLTGLSSAAAAFLFLALIPLAFFGKLIPPAAIAPALILTGARMFKSVKDIDWTDFETTLPCLLIIAMIPFSHSIPHGVGLGLICFTFIKLLRGKAKEIPVSLYVLSLLFAALYIFT